MMNYPRSKRPPTVKKMGTRNQPRHEEELIIFINTIDGGHPSCATPPFVRPGLAKIRALKPRDPGPNPVDHDDTPVLALTHRECSACTDMQRHIITSTIMTMCGPVCLLAPLITIHRGPSKSIFNNHVLIISPPRLNIRGECMTPHAQFHAPSRLSSYTACMTRACAHG